jgi:hypothetical protein
MGTRHLLDLFGELARGHVAFGTKLPRDGDDLLDCRLGLDLVDVPERPTAIVKKRAPVERDEGWRRGQCNGRDKVSGMGHAY